MTYSVTLASGSTGKLRCLFFLSQPEQPASASNNIECMNALVALGYDEVRQTFDPLKF